MIRLQRQTIFCLTVLLAAACFAPAGAPAARPASPQARAQRGPSVACVFPAGGCCGTTFTVAVSGQFLDGVNDVIISGRGVRATVIEHVKPLNPKQLNLLRDRLKELQEKIKPGNQAGHDPCGGSDANAFSIAEPNIDRMAVQKEIAEIRKTLANPKNRNRNNPQLAEDVTLRVVIAADAEPGQRELRLETNLGLTNPLTFWVGQLPEYVETEQDSNTADVKVLPPLVINGRIMPGDVDRFRLKLNKGAKLIAAADARGLIPYLADAVPGWFQATLTLYDANGNELAYADDYRFHPDPVLFYEVGCDGQYALEIKDAIYRGREDFVYRITVGELPFVTSIFPLGGRVGTQTTVEMKGWNLPSDKLVPDTNDKAPGIVPLSVHKGNLAANRIPFMLDTLPECLELEPNGSRQSDAQPIKLPVIVNGRIDQPGDWDVFCFKGRAGDRVVAEVYARRLNSPLDSVLKLTDANGGNLAANDDYEDKGAGLITHHADSLVSATLPADGTYYLHLGDAQHTGGDACAYRLRVSPPRPDFDLRVIPSGINVRPGGTATLTVVALRKDGFLDEIALTLKNAPPGFALSGGKVSAEKDEVKINLKVPPRPLKAPVSLRLEGRAVIAGRQVVHQAVPADDRMQAFSYRHLVPAKDLMVAIVRQGRPNGAAKNLGPKGAKPLPTDQPRPPNAAPGSPPQN